MRKTQLAEMDFRHALMALPDPIDDRIQRYQMDMALGMLDLTGALKDIYDKLNAIDRKIDALTFGAARNWK